MTTRLPLLGFAAALVLAAICYSAIFGADFQFDDEANLIKLETVTDLESGIDFIFSGSAGPTGRPLSLLTFALQAEQWQQGPDAFLLVNIIIHLLNALLLALVVRQLFVIRGDERERATAIGCVAASIWVTLPLIATATMFVVQRMATLSTLFMLLGLAAYLGSRTTIERSPRKALVLMAVSLTSATVLATLAKEIGLLLPIYILVAEATLLRRPERVSPAVWRIWSAVFLWLPTLIVFAYLIKVFNYPDYVIQFRGFNAVERLLTEAQLLWVYLSKALLGFSGRLGVYQGDVEVVRSLWSPAAFLAVTSWLFLAFGALLWRRRYPLLAFAVLWYLAGHLLESTVLSLELYFEHRNYLPIVGPIVALTAFLILNTDRVRTIALRVIPLVVLVNVGLLYSFASLQGNPRLAAGFWVAKYPDSYRAVGNLLDYKTSEGSTDQVIETISDFTRRHPEYATLRIQELNLMCMTRPEDVQRERVAEVRAQLKESVFVSEAIEMLFKLFATAREGQCPAVSPKTVMDMAEELRSNPKYAGHPRYNMIHHLLLAQMHREYDDAEAALAHLQKAYDAGPNTDVILMMIVTSVAAGDAAGARAFLDAAAQDEPVNPIKAIHWRREINKLYDYFDSIEIDTSERG